MLPQNEDTFGEERLHRSTAARLKELIADDNVVTFEAGLPDPEYPYISCAMWGSIPTNEIFVRLTNGSVSFVASAPSGLDIPPMSDRRSGMEPVDAAVAIKLADELWFKHRAELILR